MSRLGIASTIARDRGERGRVLGVQQTRFYALCVNPQK